MGFVVIPGSKNVDHIKDNLNIMDFELTREEMAEIAKLDKGERYYYRTDELAKSWTVDGWQMKREFVFEPLCYDGYSCGAGGEVVQNVVRTT